MTTQNHNNNNVPTAVSDKVNFAVEEQNILSYWDTIKAFETSLEQSSSEKRPLYTFYDGPPFATGLPHYGHILAGTIKDVVTRYAHQTGYHVERRFGWDTHGLPVEHEIDNKLNIKSRDDVLKLVSQDGKLHGIAAYNHECRSIVQRYTREWESTVRRVGRWIDFKNSYKTMDISYMESVWWVFSQLYNKNLVYRGYKVMPYSTACTTPLSNFEANLNYKDVSDPAITVKFKVINITKHTDTYFLAWTTTPWTLPSNMALTVNPTMRYIKIQDKHNGQYYILMKALLDTIIPPKKQAKTKKQDTNKQDNDNADIAGVTASVKQVNVNDKNNNNTNTDKQATPTLPPHDDYTVIEEYDGIELRDIHYEPLFNYLYTSYKDTAFRVVTGDFVTADSGTGVVHCAPMFGEDDMNVCIANNIISKGSDLPMLVDDSGRFTDQATDFKQQYVKDADKNIVINLKQHNKVYKSGSIVHSYPFCWRSDTPLIYRAVPSWFVRVEQIKEQLIACNEQTHWVPEHVQVGRFANWLKDARDWAISRNRYWGTPLPIWTDEQQTEYIVVESVKQLSELSGVPIEQITDLHSDKIEHITIPSKKNPGTRLKRVELVFDCWFESGSMPYAQQHYPFEGDEANQRFMSEQFPADFVSEGLDQTRGWFYTLMVLSTALYNKPAFKHLICSGLVLAADGKKMSKRLKNYPDPLTVIDKYGADALRLYLISSPVVRAESLRFKEEGVFELVKTVFLPLYHAYRFCIENILRYNNTYNTTFALLSTTQQPNSDNLMDQWILASLSTLIEYVHTEMKAYRLYTVVPRLLYFIEQLTNWYVRTNRKRLKGSQNTRQDNEIALCVLTYVTYQVIRLLSPLIPFITESMYQNIKKLLPVNEQQDSIHYCMLPIIKQSHDITIERQVKCMQTVVELGRQARDNRKISMKRPLYSVTIVHKSQQYLDDCKRLHEYIEEELNVQNVYYSNDVSKYATLTATINKKLLGPKLGKSLAEYIKLIDKLTQDQLNELDSTGNITIKDTIFTKDEIETKLLYNGDTNINEAINGDVLVIVDTTFNNVLQQQYIARELANRVQQLRKTSGLSPSDPINAYIVSNDINIQNIIQQQQQYIQNILLLPLQYIDNENNLNSKLIGKNDIEVILDDDNKYNGSVILTQQTI